MPVRWTPEKDQLLLLKILETHEISVDSKKVIAAWPEDQGEAPTARAITERLVKIRQLARSNGAGHFNISSAQTKVSSTTSTPRSSAKTPGSGRPKYQARGVGDDDEEAPEDSPSPAKRPKVRGKLPSRYVQPKDEPSDDDDDVQIVTRTPAKFKPPPAFAGDAMALSSGPNGNARVKTSIEEDDEGEDIFGGAATASTASRTNSHLQHRSSEAMYELDDEDAV